MSTRTVEIIECTTQLPGEGVSSGSDTGNFKVMQSILLTSVSQQSAAFSAETNLLIIQLPVDLTQATPNLNPFRVQFGLNPTAVNAPNAPCVLLYPGTLYRFRVPAGQGWKIALIEGAFQ